MSDPENTTQPLLNQPAAQSGRSSRAYKVAGITLLACVLIVGQAMIAYFLLSQRNDIKSLEEQNNNLKAEMTRGRSVSAPMRMHIPVKAMPELMVDALDEDSSTGTTEKTPPPQATDCQLEAAGVKPVPVPNFRPTCDDRGFYTPKQCFGKHCWCVNPSNGQEVPGSLREGPVICAAPVRNEAMMALANPVA